MLPRPGSTPGGLRETERARPNGWNVMTDKGLSPEVLCHHSLRKSLCVGFDSSRLHHFIFQRHPAQSRSYRITPVLLDILAISSPGVSMVFH